MEFRKYKISEISKSLFYGSMPKNEDIAEDGKYPIFSGYRFVGYSNKKNIEEPTLIVVARGVGGTGDVKIAPANSFLTNLSIAVDIDEEIADKKFLYYFLNLQGLRYLDTGAAQSQITINNLKRHSMLLPDLSTQKKISHILSNYDELIENNNKRITMLEQMAENLYKEWFVRFRFPNHENTEFENGIPKGWEIKKLGDIARVKSGYAFKSEWWTDEGVPVIKIKDIQNNTIDFSDLSRVSEENTANAKQFFVVEGDLLIAMTGATIGKLALVPHSDEKLVVNQRVGKFFCGDTPINKVAFLYYTLQQNWVQELIAMIAGSNAAQPNISPFDIEKIKVLYNKEVVNLFNEKVSTILEQLLLLRKTNQNLIKQRDLLLPRLMSGKLEV